MGNFRYRSLQCHFLTVICAKSQFNYSCELQYLLACVQLLPTRKKIGKSLSSSFLSGGSLGAPAIFLFTPVLGSFVKYVVNTTLSS